MKNLITFLLLTIVAITNAQPPITTKVDKINIKTADLGNRFDSIALWAKNKEFKHMPISTLGTLISTPNEFTEEQREEILDLIYKPNQTTFSVATAAGERGISTAVTLNYNIISNDDVFTAASINQSVGSVLSNVNAGAQSVSGGSRTASTTYTLSMTYNRNGVSTPETKTATYSTYVPQWAGVSSATDFTNSYATINGDAGLQKYIQASSTITKVVSPSAQYVWFIVTNATGQILDGNNFVQTVGTWDDGVSEFYRKSLTLTLADGTTSATVYLIRSRNTKTLTSFTYKSN